MSGLVKDIFLYSNCTPWNTSCLLSFCQTLLEREAALFPPGPVTVTGTLLSTLRAETPLLARRGTGAADPVDLNAEAAALMGVWRMGCALTCRQTPACVADLL